MLVNAKEVKMDYLKLLENSYEMEKMTSDCPPETRLAFLSEHIFNITTYDGKMDDFFGRKAVEVCAAITNRTTFAFIKNPDNYQWFLIICNMPFFCTRLGWGTSIRGAWWDFGYDNGKENTSYNITSCGIWDGEEQLTELQFSEEEWVTFMQAIVEFSQIKMTPNAKLTGREMTTKSRTEFTRAPVERDVRQCCCLRCIIQRDKEAGILFQSAMQSCSSCGNKRCPKGTNHDLTCTGSNEPGQDGSSYA